METDVIQEIAIELLDAHPGNPRLFMREEVIESIANQIRDKGEFDVAYALLVRPLNGRYQIVDGHHRLIAAQRAGLSKVPCWVREMTDDEAYMQMGLLNHAQDRLKGLELGIHALFAVEPGEKGRGKKGGLREYARLMGVSHEYVRKMRNAAEVFVYCMEQWWREVEDELEKMSTQLTFFPVDFLPDKCPKCKKDLMLVTLEDKELHLVYDKGALACIPCRLVFSIELESHAFLNYGILVPLLGGLRNK